MAILHDSKVSPSKLVEYLYRKEFGLSKHQLDEESYDDYLVNLRIMNLLRIKESNNA